MIIYRSIQDRAIDQALARIKPVAVNELVAVNSRRGAYPGTDARRAYMRAVLQTVEPASFVRWR